MSFLAELETFSKDKLKLTKTRVTTVEGKKLIEYKKEGEQVTVDTGEITYGFCEDTKPDGGLCNVSEGIYLSSQDGASNLEELKKNGVTHILNVATGVENIFVDEFVYKNVELLDLPETDIRAHFQEIFEFIKTGLQDGAILIHCNAGVSRSSTVVIAYLMKSRNISLDSAFALVKEARPCIRPNDGFWKQLRDYEQEILAV